MKKLALSILITMIVLAIVGVCTWRAGDDFCQPASLVDTVPPYQLLIALPKSAQPHATQPPAKPKPRPTKMPPKDRIVRPTSTYSPVKENVPATVFDSLAMELGVEVAAFKAVSRIESGKSHTAFIAPGAPLVNLEVSLFKKKLASAGYDVDSLVKVVPDAFKRPSRRRYSNTAVAQQAMYNAAASIDEEIAKLCTYWGMYQIRGTNWKQCGTQSVDDFVEKMSQSEVMQHRLFVQYLKRTGMDKMLAAKDWRRFARAYNGAGYARHGYHTRLAEAYNYYKNGGK